MNEPWRRGDVVRLGAFSVAGIATLLVAWWGVSGTARVSHEVTWVNVAAAGALLLGFGNGLWLSRGRRAVGERRRRLLDSFEHVAVTSVEPHQNAAGAKPVAAVGMKHYHHPDCQLVQGKVTTAATLAAHRRAHRQPCGICQL